MMALGIIERIVLTYEILESKTALVPPALL